jgi:hypothetical protein
MSSAGYCGSVVRARGCIRVCSIGRKGGRRKRLGRGKKPGLAEQMSLPYEAARAHYEIGRHLQIHEPARRIHLEKAVEVFLKLNAKCELEQAQKLLAEN